MALALLATLRVCTAKKSGNVFEAVFVGSNPKRIM
jgi:hypothetical protein